MEIVTAYVLFCALPLMLAFVAIAGGLALIAYLDDRRHRPPREPAPIGGLQKVLERWKAAPMETRP